VLRQARNVAWLGGLLLLGAGLLYIMALHWLSPSTRLVYALVYVLLCAQAGVVLLLAGYCERPRLALLLTCICLLSSGLFFYYAHAHYGRFPGAHCTVASCWYSASWASEASAAPSRSRLLSTLQEQRHLTRPTCPASYAMSVDAHARAAAAVHTAQYVA
jgi:hypothetical protein